MILPGTAGIAFPMFSNYNRLIFIELHRHARPRRHAEAMPDRFGSGPSLPTAETEKYRLFFSPGFVIFHFRDKLSRPL